MTQDKIENIIKHYRLLAEQSDMHSEQDSFRYRNFANIIETNLDLLEDCETEEELWDFYNEQSNDGFDLLYSDEFN